MMRLKIWRQATRAALAGSSGFESQKLPNGSKRVDHPCEVDHGSSKPSCWASLRAMACSHKLLTLILTAGLVLRMANILWGLPVQPYAKHYYDPDEPQVFGQALGFPENLFRNPPYAYGSTFPYAVGALCCPARDLFVKHLGAPGAYELLIVVACRLVSILAGTGAILLAYMLGRYLAGESAGLYAAVFTCFSFTHCINSALCNLDVLMSFLLLANLLYLFTMMQPASPSSSSLACPSEPGIARFIILGVLSGLLVGTKISIGCFLVLPIAFAAWHVWRTARFRPHPIRLQLLSRWAGLLSVYVAVVCLVYAVTNPHIIFQLSEYVQYMRELKRGWYDSHPKPWPMVLRYWLEQSRLALGSPMVGLAGTGALLCWPGRHICKLGLLAVLAMHYAMFPNYFMPRYVAVVAPIFCVLAGILCASLTKNRWLPVRAVGTYLGGITILYSMACCAIGIYANLRDARDAAASFMNDSISLGSTFATVSPCDSDGIWQYPPVDEGRFPRASLAEKPDVLLISEDHYQFIHGFFARGRIGRDFKLDQDGIAEWQPLPLPPPEVLKASKSLYEPNGGYELIQVCPPPIGLLPEYASHGIRIYRRKDPPGVQHTIASTGNAR